jgi:hypothetical protein
MGTLRSAGPVLHRERCQHGAVRPGERAQSVTHMTICAATATYLALAVRRAWQGLGLVDLLFGRIWGGRRRRSVHVHLFGLLLLLLRCIARRGRVRGGRRGGGRRRLRRVGVRL